MGNSAITWVGLTLTLVFVGAYAPAADRTQLEEVPNPDISGFEDVIRLRLEALQEQVQLLEAGEDDIALAEAYGSLAKHYLAHTLDEQAGVAFANAQTLAPDDARWSYYLAYVQFRAGEHEAAMATYKRVLELEPGNIPTLLHLGEVALEMGENEKAYDDYRRALELNPVEAAAHAGIGKTAATLERPQEAIEALRRALELQPQATALHYQLALAYRKAGLADEAALVRENLWAMRRAGSDLIITYHGRDALRKGWIP